MSRRASIIAAGICFFIAVVCFGEMTAPSDSREHAPMEVLGIGPEMFQNRASAWFKALGQSARDAISEFGLVILAIIALKKNIANSEIKERLDRVDDRTKETAAAVTQVALAAVPADGKTVKIEQPPNEPIPVKEVKPNDQ